MSESAHLAPDADADLDAEPFGHESGRSTPAAIAVSEVCVDAGDGRTQRRILDHIDLTVAPGELVAVMGPSGSGKSTLLGVCGGLIVPDSGIAEVDGHPLPPPGSSTLAVMWRRTLGYVEQRQNLIDLLTTAENVALPLRFGMRPEHEVRAATAAALEEVGLGDAADVLASDLSGGEQQRAAIARALIGTRSIVVADEPTAALDTAAGETIMRLLRRRCDERGVAVLLATHDARHAAWADRVVNLRDGRVLSVLG